VRTLAPNLFRAMVFAQLTWRESLRDIEASMPGLQTLSVPDFEKPEI
jgi:hypothetical protein